MFICCHVIIPEIVKQIHFSNENLQNSNIRLKNNDEKSDFVEVYNEGHWVAKDKDLIINELVEKGYQMKQNKLAELVQLVKELQEWRDGYGLYQSGQKESFNAILAKASQIAEPTVDVCQEVTREMAIADLVKENRRLKEIVNSNS